MSNPLPHIKKIEVKRVLGPYITDEVILFNAERISSKEALWMARADEYNDNVLCIPKRQWLSLFKNEPISTTPEKSG